MFRWDQLFIQSPALHALTHISWSPDTEASWKLNMSIFPSVQQLCITFLAFLVAAYPLSWRITYPKILSSNYIQCCLHPATIGACQNQRRIIRNSDDSNRESVGNPLVCATEHPFIVRCFPSTRLLKPAILGFPEATRWFPGCPEPQHIAAEGTAWSIRGIIPVYSASLGEMVKHLGVSKNRGKTPKWMIYNGKPY